MPLRESLKGGGGGGQERQEREKGEGASRRGRREEKGRAGGASAPTTVNACHEPSKPIGVVTGDIKESRIAIE